MSYTWKSVGTRDGVALWVEQPGEDPRVIGSATIMKTGGYWANPAMSVHMTLEGAMRAVEEHALANETEKALLEAARRER